MSLDKKLKLFPVGRAGGLDASGNTISPNAVNKITSKDNVTGNILNEQLFTYDANGNMLTHINPLGESRDMLWDEKNMMKAILIGGQMFQHNVFDSNGQRVLKGKGDMSYVAINGNPQNPNSSIGNYTRYVNGFMVVGANNTVTKHYYNGSERIVSRLAGSVNLYTEDTNISDTHLDTLPINQNNELNYLEAELNLNPIVLIEADTLGDCEVSGTCASVLYFFHPDHLGSSTFLSDADGQAYQFLLYLPWGESMAEQKAGGYATPYKYTGKELDTEIGMYDYGARFYDPSISLWTSVDPLTEKYPAYSAYNYVMGNPIRYIDPDGMQVDDIIIPYKGKDYEYKNGKLYLNGTEFTGKQKGFLRQATDALNIINSKAEGNSMIDELSNSSNKFEIKRGSSSKFKSDVVHKAYANQLRTDSDPKAIASQKALLENGLSLSGGSGGTIYFNPSGTSLPTTSKTGTSITPATDLAHEMFHALDSNRGLMDDRPYLGIERNEWQASFRENVLRSQLSLPLRTHYRTSEDPSGNYLGPLPPNILSNGGPTLPSWYKR